MDEMHILCTGSTTNCMMSHKFAWMMFAGACVSTRDELEGNVSPRPRVLAMTSRVKLLPLEVAQIRMKDSQWSKAVVTDRFHLCVMKQHLPLLLSQQMPAPASRLVVAKMESID